MFLLSYFFMSIPLFLFSLLPFMSSSWSVESGFGSCSVFRVSDPLCHSTSVKIKIASLSFSAEMLRYKCSPGPSSTNQPWSYMKNISQWEKHIPPKAIYIHKCGDGKGGFIYISPFPLFFQFSFPLPLSFLPISIFISIAYPPLSLVSLPLCSFQGWNRVMWPGEPIQAYYLLRTAGQK